jgi:DNA-binding transcriptional LysR family regulator
MTVSHDMSAFIAIAERGSFAAAAYELGLTPSAVSKLVSRIEDRLGVKLLIRTTRKLALTDEGRLYLARSKDIVAAIEAAESEVSESGIRPSGVLRVNTGTAFGRHQLAPVLPVFLSRYPEITVELGISDRQVNLMTEQVDVAIRIGDSDDSNLIVRKLTEARRIICASPAYLERHGTPQVPSDLLHHNCILVRGHGVIGHWPFSTPEGVNTLQVSGTVACDSADIVREMALSGLGIVRLGDMLVGQSIRCGELVEILHDRHTAQPSPINAVMLPGRNRLPRVRVFVDFLVEQFRSGTRF